VQRWYDDAVERKALITPDITFFIDIQPATSFKRKGRTIQNSGDNPWQREDFLALMKQYYVNLMQSDNENIIRIDGEQNWEKVETEILAAIFSRVAD
jgi:thymidylate kinase